MTKYTSDAGLSQGPPLAWARYYTERGWRCVPVPLGEKGPRERGWQEWRLTLDDLPRWFADGKHQIGILLGELTAYSGILPSRDSIFILSKADLLTEDSRRAILDRLPGGTLAVSAATGEGVEEFLTRLSKAVREARRSSPGQSSAPRGGERAETS